MGKHNPELTLKSEEVLKASETLNELMSNSQSSVNNISELSRELTELVEYLDSIPDKIDNKIQQFNQQHIELKEHLNSKLNQLEQQILRNSNSVEQFEGFSARLTNNLSYFKEQIETIRNKIEIVCDTTSRLNLDIQEKVNELKLEKVQLRQELESKIIELSSDLEHLVEVNSVHTSDQVEKLTSKISELQHDLEKSRKQGLYIQIGIVVIVILAQLLH